MHLCFNPVLSQPMARFLVLSGQWLCCKIHSFSLSSRRGRLRKRCFSFLNSISCFLHTLHLGFCSCSGSSTVLHFSHWSPLAESYPQTGHVPIMYLSGRKRLSCL